MRNLLSGLVSVFDTPTCMVAMLDTISRTNNDLSTSKLVMDNLCEMVLALQRSDSFLFIAIHIV